MSEIKPGISIPVDLTNPGQFFACCGLLEIADRLDPGSVGWFKREARFEMSCGAQVGKLLKTLIAAPPDEFWEFSGLEVKRIVAPLAIKLADQRFVLDFWLKVNVKAGQASATAAKPWNLWSGKQRSLDIWEGLRRELKSSFEDSEERLNKDPFSVLRPMTGRFGFDATAGWKPLDLGFSPNALQMEVSSSPAVELLAAVGMQRFRPTRSPADRYQYWPWQMALPPAIAAAASSGLMGGVFFSFPIDDRGQNYAAFGAARKENGHGY